MARTPDMIVLRRHRDLRGRRREQWIRRLILLLLLVFAILGATNQFGQRASTASAQTEAATLEIRAPKALRGGLLYQARFTTTAHRELKKATLVLGSGWFEGMQLNTLEPSPIGESSRNGSVVFELGHIPAGQKHVLYLQLQVNPTDVGSRTQSVELWDGDERLLSLNRSLRIFP
jgi:hypothetical protein